MILSNMQMSNKILLLVMYTLNQKRFLLEMFSKEMVLYRAMNTQRTLFMVKRVLCVVKGGILMH